MTRLLTKKVPYTFNRSGYYYFSRRVPADLLSHYSYPRIVQGLKTRSAQTAKSRALVAAAKLDEYWSHLRMTDPDLIGRSLLKSGYGSSVRNTQLDVSTATEQLITLSEALETYVTQKGAGKPKTFKAAALFNSYTDETGCKGNSCSGALNKWLKQHVPDAVIHSLRHSFRDRLRNAGVQSEMIDQLGGWSRETVGQGYGRGYHLSILSEKVLLLATK